MDIFLNPAIPVLFLSGIMPVMNFSHGLGDLKFRAFFGKNLVLALDSCAVFRLGSIISLLGSWLGEPLWIPASWALVDWPLTSLLDCELNCWSERKIAAFFSQQQHFSHNDFACFGPGIPAATRHEMPVVFSHGWELWILTLSVRFPGAQNSGRQILLASKMSCSFLLLDLEKSCHCYGWAVCCNIKSFVPKWLILNMCSRLCTATL